MGERWSDDDSSNNLSVNGCTAYSEQFPDLLHWRPLQVLFGILYTSVWLGGVGGNCLILYVVVVRRCSFSVRTIFIVSLSCSDLLVAMASLPVTSITLFTDNWLFPHFLCNSISFLQACSVLQSSFTLTAIAVDRYCLIFFPHRPVVTVVRAQCGMLLMLLVGVMIASPLAVFSKIIVWPGVCGEFCTEEWPPGAEWAGKLYGMSVLTLQFGLPLCVSCFCYLNISQHLDGRLQQRLRHEIILPEAMKRSDERRRRTNRMMAFMVASFVLTWCPLNVINVVRDFGPAEQPIFFNTLYAFSHLLAMTSLIGNPIIYSWFNETLRREIRGVVCLRPLQERTATGTTTMLTSANVKLAPATPSRHGGFLPCKPVSVLL